jgi:hypothetical protein
MDTGRADRAAVRQELSLVRSAVLYADEVCLMSAGVELLLAHQDMLARAERSDVLTWLEGTPGLREYVESLPDVELALSEIAERIRASEGVWRSEYAEFDLGRSTGTVTVMPFTSISSAPHGGLGGELGDGERFFARLAKLLNDPDLHPLLDRQAAEWARELITRSPETINEDSHRRARTAELGAGMIARLPAFPQAPLDELLDLKAELTSALVRYRAVISELQQLVVADIGARELDSQLDDLWIRKIQPTLIDLEDELTAHGLVREIARSAATSARSLVTQGAGLYIALSTLANLASQISAAAAVAGVTLETVAAGAGSSILGKRQAAKNDFYYLYRLSRQIQRD